MSFLPVGHTHEDIDQAWSRTSIAIKREDVCCEAELFEVIRKAFHHEGYHARCGSLDKVANIKDWLLAHCNEVHGVAGRGILHFRILPHADGHAIYTKHRSGDTWRQPGHIYETASEGFHLLRTTVPLPPFRAGVRRPPPLRPKEQSAELLKRLRSALNACNKDNRVSPDAWRWLAESLDKLEDTQELPFYWLDDGQLLCEKGVEARGERIPHRFLPGAENRAAVHALELEAEEVDRQRADKAAPDSGDEAVEKDAEELLDAGPRRSGLRTAAQEKQRKDAAAAAEDERSFHVEQLAAGHFVVFLPTDEDRGMRKRKA